MKFFFTANCTLSTFCSNLPRPFVAASRTSATTVSLLKAYTLTKTAVYYRGLHKLEESLTVIINRTS